VCGPANGRATRENKPASGADPNRSRAWKIADFPGNRYTSRHPDAHAKPSVSWDNTSSYEPSEYKPIAIAKYAITRAGNDRCRC
jgi:hypothetical protein